MTVTISNSRTSPVVLDNGTYSVDITKTGKITAAYGIIGPDNTIYTTIDNAGIIHATTFGIAIPYYASIQNTGSIYGTDAGIFLSAGSLSNSGTIAGKTIAAFISGYAEDFTGSAFFTNTQGGQIKGTEIGVILKPYLEQSIIFTNVGTVSGQIAGAYDANSTLHNNGLITSNTYGVYLQGGLVTNTGTITSKDAGISLNLGTLTNQTAPVNATLTNSGYVYGNKFGISFNTTTNFFPGNGNINNTGTIKSAAIGIAQNYTTIFNNGLIQGGNDGIILQAGSIFNDGTIKGGSIAIDAIGALNLYVDGGVFKGAVTDDSNEGALFLEGSSASLDIGTSFTGFSAIDFAGGNSLALEAGSIAIAAGQTITGFTYGDTIILDNFAVNTLDTTYISGTGLELTDTLGHHITLDITGNFSTANFIVTDPPGDTTIEAICYLRGTRIATPAGDISIENLNIGDTVITRFQGYRKIKWIGRQSFSQHFIRNNADKIPVRITAGALAPSIPQRDLLVSPGHSMLIGAKLILAKNLINGVTILQSPPAQDIHYYQLEFETHDCILAEGAWSESYADTPDWRAQFHNVDEFHQLFPHHIAPATQILCAPRPLEGPDLEILLRPMVAYATARTDPGRLHGFIDEIAPNGNIRGWAWDEANQHLPVLLEILAGSHRLGTALACQPRADLKAAGYGQGQCGFIFTSPVGLPPDPAQITIRRLADGAPLRDCFKSRSGESSSGDFRAPERNVHQYVSTTRLRGCRLRTRQNAA